jgi:hypothetical protein
MIPSVGALALSGVQASFSVAINNAKLYVGEFESLNQNALSGVEAPMAHCPPLALQAIPFGTTVAFSAPFSSRTRVIRLHTDTVCAVYIGGLYAGVTAGLNGAMRMAANQTEYFAVKPGDTLAVVTSS